ncbi:unnamed protein product (macronuclear) [Paramecium tetraurelia]|uniref:Short-chain dehydrogenase/reductase 3 n=1 Tax=Paramecium tetraurelia TaxID=5888 RepID=A0DCG9_PARTE|nr:uncharacterized protein GSPATT00015614001 [Paramecium tetraurelia]CAK80736.1 unnamed protein product [Paramecium tetraurelia]|eukprot:XP_001448133.1 hypothetical protein (macronuclear) [Paramecium tetraurelia strain d4-2]
MNKLQSFLTRGQDFWQKFYEKKGKKGVAQVAALGLGLLYLQYQVRKHNGWLKKKSVVNEHIFITGGASGIGKNMALRFARLGAKISIVDVNEDALNQVVGQINSLHGEKAAFGVKCDVSDPQSVKNAIKKCIDFHQKKIDILINNAGVVSGKQILENTDAGIARTMNINTTAHHWTVREVLGDMIANKHGHIVTIASIAGWVGVRGLADYCASKFGAVGFDESLRFELRATKSNVKTTCICPYFINTGMFDGAKSKFPLLFPILSENYATTRIVNAVLQDETVVIMPIILNLSIMVKAIFPTCIYDNMMELFGVSESMDHFKGRQQ